MDAPAKTEPEPVVEVQAAAVPEAPAEPAPKKRPPSRLFLALKEAIRTYEKLSAQVPVNPDEETVHEFRVASRRLQVAVDLARRVLSGQTASRVERRIKARFDATSVLRDVQTWRPLLASWREAFPEATALLDGHLAVLEEAQLRTVLKTLRKKPADTVITGLKPLLAAARRERDDQHLRRVADKRLDRAFQRLEQARRAVDAGRAETLHGFRLRLKIARYAVEVAAPFHPEKAPAALEAFKAHQTAIGDWHDLDLLVHAFDLFALDSPALIESCSALLEALRARLEEAARTLVTSLPAAADLDPRPAEAPEEGPWTLVLLRHAQATDRQDWGERPDEERPLTQHGEKQARRAAKALADWGVRVERILTSPAVRARHTAEIVARHLHAGKRLETARFLASEADARGVVGELAVHARAGTVLLLVGHEPQLGELASMLVSGRRSLPIELPTGGLVAITLEKAAWKACGRLSRLMPPEGLPARRRKKARAASAAGMERS
jgi:phosphohistidine phosphatase